MEGSSLAFSIGGLGQRSITIKPVDLLKSVSKAIIKAGAGAYTDALAELPDIVASVGLSATPQERVAVLVLRALERALTALVAEAKERDGIVPNVHAASFLGLSKEVAFEVSRDFFKNPNAEVIVASLKPDAELWLTTIGMLANDVSNLMVRLPSVFLRALHDEWRSNAIFYRVIKDDTDSPFTGAAEMEKEWSRYSAYLISMSEGRVFDESFSLRQIYVRPRCYFLDKQGKTDQQKEFATRSGHKNEPVKVFCWAHTEIKSWIERQDRDFSIRFITGGPGSGKSSLAKILASDLTIAGKRVLFVPLHQMDLDVGISRALSDFFLQAGHFADDPLTSEAAGPTVLLLDGLDEIQMQGRAAQESAQGFVTDLIRYIDRRNTASCKLLCLITGRDLAVEAAESSLKVVGQVLHIAPYSVEKDEILSSVNDEEMDITDQRDEWWAKYGRLTGQKYDKMPDALRAGELNDVTSQPLLNYLVALSYQRGLKLDESTNVNSVYEDLLRAVYERAWARHSHPSVKNVSYEAFVRLLEEVALAVWHGAGRTTTLAEVEAHCHQSKLGALLPSFQSGVSSGVSSLLLAFYFRQKGRRDDGSKTFEFTHKTFSEYLISLRVVRLVELLSSQMTLHYSNPDLGVDERDALYRWLNICGQSALDRYLLDFIRREIGFRSAAQAATLQKSLQALLETAMSSGWPVQKVERLSFVEQQNYVRNAEETLLACLNSCALISKEISLVRWPSETAAGEMIARLRGQRKGPANRPVMSCLSYLNYDGQYLDMVDLYGAQLHHSSFVGARLNYAVLLQANLTRSTLLGARLQGANLASANLTEARVQLAELRRSLLWSEDRLILEKDDKTLTNNRLSRSSFTSRLEKMLRRGMIVVDESGIPIDKEKVMSEFSDYIHTQIRTRSLR